MLSIQLCVVQRLLQDSQTDSDVSDAKRDHKSQTDRMDTSTDSQTVEGKDEKRFEQAQSQQSQSQQSDSVSARVRNVGPLIEQRSSAVAMFVISRYRTRVGGRQANMPHRFDSTVLQ
jgi:hypothetical protein